MKYNKASVYIAGMESYTVYPKINEVLRHTLRKKHDIKSIDEVSKEFGLSKDGLRALFTNWCGVNPKDFLALAGLHNPKQFVQKKKLDNDGQLLTHQKFIEIIDSPDQFWDGVTITYGYMSTPFGELIVASTPKGICYMAFLKEGDHGLEELRQRFHKADIKAGELDHIKLLQNVFEGIPITSKIRLHLKGTPFQLRVWKALASIPYGHRYAYGTLAAQLNNPKAVRAVGTAVGKNPIAYLIPCHRVVRTNGHIGEYMWGSPRKAAILGWEATRLSQL